MICVDGGCVAVSPVERFRCVVVRTPRVIIFSGGSVMRVAFTPAFLDVMRTLGCVPETLERCGRCVRSVAGLGPAAGLTKSCVDCLGLR